MSNLAILIGFSEYTTSTPGFPPLHGIDTAINNMKTAFQEVCGCEHQNMITICEKCSAQDILRNIIISSYEQSASYDNLYLYYSGHGLTDSAGNACILPPDSVVIDEQDGVLCGELRVVDLLRVIKSSFQYNHLIVFLDTCRSPLQKNGWDLHTFHPEEFPKDTIVFSSTLPYHSAFADTQKGGYFTQCLHEILYAEIQEQTAEQISWALRAVMREKYTNQSPLIQFSGTNPRMVKVAYGGFRLIEDPPTWEEETLAKEELESNNAFAFEFYGQENCTEQYHMLQRLTLKKQYSTVYLNLQEWYKSKTVRFISSYLKRPNWIPFSAKYKNRLSNELFLLDRYTLHQQIELANAQCTLEQLVKAAEHLLRIYRVYVHVGYDKAQKDELPKDNILYKQLSALHYQTCDLMKWTDMLRKYNGAVAHYARCVGALWNVLKTCIITDAIPIERKKVEQIIYVQNDLKCENKAFYKAQKRYWKTLFPPMPNENADI